MGMKKKPTCVIQGCGCHESPHGPSSWVLTLALLGGSAALVLLVWLLSEVAR
jgi:hypothetical protein